jgi:hypothetical protein
VIVGCTATGLVVFLFTLFVFSVIDARLYRAFIAEGAGVTAREAALFYALSGVSHLVALLLAFGLGGLVTGAVADAFPGLNGAVGAAVAGALDLGADQQPRRGLHAVREPRQPGGVERGLLRSLALRRLRGLRWCQAGRAVAEQEWSLIP